MGYKHVAGPDRAQAGLWREMHTRGHLERVESISKVKAHLTEGETTTQQEWLDFRGNDKADQFAKKGAQIHVEGWVAATIADYRRGQGLQAQGVQAIGRMLAQYPPARKLWPKVDSDESQHQGVPDGQVPGDVIRLVPGVEAADQVELEAGDTQDWDHEEQVALDWFGDDAMAV